MADRIAVIGAGQMGNGIAHVFAQAGFDVVMIDVAQQALDKGRDTIAKNLDRQVKKGSIAETDKSAILGRVSTATSTDAVKGAARTGRSGKPPCRAWRRGLPPDPRRPRWPSRGRRR